MKQTQTKHYSWGDTGLDFCASSMNLIQDRFKKMFVYGFNERTVSSVSVLDDQVTLTYAQAHGYAAERVIKVMSGPLADINEGEFWIDSVTTNTITITVDAAPSSISGGFITKIAPLGWDLVYEVDDVQIYRFKDLDESDLYLRMLWCFSGLLAIMPCVGRSYDPDTGFIDDPYANSNKDAMEYNWDNTVIKWCIYALSPQSYPNYTYMQGFNLGIGGAATVGSKYHVGIMCSSSTTSNPGHGQISAIIPAAMLDYPQLNYPVLLGNAGSGPITGRVLKLFCGNVELTLVHAGGDIDRFKNGANNSFLNSSLDTFDTTVAYPFTFREFNTQQVLGYSAGGAFWCGYGSDVIPSKYSRDNPVETAEIDFSSKMIIHYTGSSASLFVAFPLEEVKHGY